MNKKLLKAAEKGHIGTVKDLIESGADVNAKDEYSYTALMYAVKEGHIEIVKALINAGANVHAKNDFGETALMLEPDNNSCEVAKLLLEKGADVNAKDEYSYTALMEKEAKDESVQIGTSADYVSTYETTRTITKLISSIGWVIVIIGLLAFLIVALSALEDARRWLGLLPAVGGIISGLLLVIAGQFTRATVDNVDNTGQILKLIKKIH